MQTLNRWRWFAGCLIGLACGWTLAASAQELLLFEGKFATVPDFKPRALQRAREELTGAETDKARRIAELGNANQFLADARLKLAAAQRAKESLPKMTEAVTAAEQQVKTAQALVDKAEPPRDAAQAVLAKNRQLLADAKQMLTASNRLADSIPALTRTVETTERNAKTAQTAVEQTAPRIAAAEQKVKDVESFRDLTGTVKFYARPDNGPKGVRPVIGLVETEAGDRLELDRNRNNIELLGIVSGDGIRFELVRRTATTSTRVGEFDATNFISAQGLAYGIARLPAPNSTVQVECQWQAATQAMTTVLEANPGLLGGQHTEHLDDDALAALTLRREGVATDGASRLLVRVRTLDRGEVKFGVAGQARTEGAFVPLARQVNNGDARVNADGSVTARTVETEGRHFAFAHYEPPAYYLDQGAPGERFKNEVEARDATLQLRFLPPPPNTNANVSWTQTTKLARPPVLLVHGTFDNPANCWQTPGPEGITLERRLQNAGFKVFLTDYRASSGAGQQPSSFRDNKMVVWANPGGIAEALRFYREQLNLAATQADIVGHSMGGLLPRVYASAGYPGSHPYSRDENFSKGDLHRLLTIATPHHGSDLPRLLQHLKDAKFQEHTFSDYCAAHGIAMLSEYLAGNNNPGASTNQIPESPALKAIGATPVPAHAIVCVAEANTLDDFNGRYSQGLLGICAAFYLNMGLLETYLDRYGQWVDASNLVDFIEVTDWRNDNFLLQPLATIEGKKNDYTVLRLKMRAAIFGNWENDGVVRLASQSGSLLPEHSSIIKGVLHSFAPRYRAVQDQVITALRAGPEKYSPRGFLPAGEAVANLRVNLSPTSDARRREAIRRSGMVPGHAEAISDIAAKRREILIARPVNADATVLIARNAATKGMLIKGKSSNWGPQQGLISVEQRYSKIWRAEPDPGRREREIAAFNAEVQESLNVTKVARAKDLALLINGQKYRVLRLKPEQRQPSAEDEIILQHQASGAFWDWRNVQNESGAWTDFSDAVNPVRPPPVTFRPEDLISLQVLATPDEEGRYITADYDLLAIGTLTAPEAPKFDKDLGMGYVNAAQMQMIVDLNQAVRAYGKYHGGKVVHHGPETQYSGSTARMVDYPLTIFDPTGVILTIEPTKADVDNGAAHAPLKHYFARKKRSGWFLDPNPRWRWEWNRDYDAVRGYQEEDAPLPTAEELEADNEYKKDKSKGRPLPLKKKEQENP